MSTDEFWFIYDDDLSSTEKKVLKAFLRGLSPLEIRGDKTVWLPRRIGTMPIEELSREVEDIKNEQTQLEHQKENLENRIRNGETSLDENLKQVKKQLKRVNIDYSKWNKYLTRRTKKYESPDLLSHHKLEIITKFGARDMDEVIRHCAYHIPNDISPEALRNAGLVGLLDVPHGFLTPDDPLYQYRRDPDKAEEMNKTLEDECIDIIKLAGTQPVLLRLKSPILMGKTSLMKRLLKDKVAVEIDLDNRTAIFEQNIFYQWLCENIIQQLTLVELEKELKSQWNSLSDSLQFEPFFKNLIIPKIEKKFTEPIFIAIDNLHKIFYYKDYQGFIETLRKWYDSETIKNTWLKKIVFIITYSTHDFPTHGIKGSPFWNLGEGKELKDFSEKEIINLSLKHDLETRWEQKQVQQLMKKIGGHPYLVRLTLYHIVVNKKTLTEILDNATNENSIYLQHLEKLSEYLEENQNLKEDLKKVVNSYEPVIISPISRFNLYSAGLVNKYGLDKAESRNVLYREYFKAVL
ncbi:MAG: AAA-like domain-containing protein [Crocosphaera sp.]